MQNSIELKQQYHPQSGASIKYCLEALDRYCACITEDKPLPKFKRARYVAPDNLWSHDHCIFCSSTFSEVDDYGKGTLGWIVDDPGQDVPMKSNCTKVRQKSGVVTAPKNARNWMCNDCHQIIHEWKNGDLNLALQTLDGIPNGNL